MPKDKVFIIEDDLPALESLKNLLLTSDFEVEGLSAPKEIMKSIKSFGPDIILLDLLMPGLGGLEVCQMLNSDEQTRDVPIIVISALANPADIKKAYELGVVDYLTKPYIYSELDKKIKKFISYKKNRVIK
ncbi:MAG: response regulator [Candidatus Omnitrophota bacterium]